MALEGPFYPGANNTDGKITSVVVDGVTMATPAYDATTQELTSIGYTGGIALTGITRDAGRCSTGQQWSIGGTTVTDAVVRSQAGRVLQQSSTMGAVTNTSTYGYDIAGRLISATIPGHQLSYGFASTGGCGVNTAAVRDVTGEGGVTDHRPGRARPGVDGHVFVCVGW